MSSRFSAQDRAYRWRRQAALSAQAPAQRPTLWSVVPEGFPDRFQEAHKQDVHGPGIGNGARELNAPRSPARASAHLAPFCRDLGGSQERFVGAALL